MADGDGAIELHVWKGDWGLPSIDSNCLAALAYCKFSGVPMRVIKTGNPWSSPSGDFPMLRHGNFKGTKVGEIFNYLRKENWGSDFNLTNKEGADVVAFVSLLEEKLLPAVLHLWWVDTKNYVDITRPWYGKAISFPLNFYIPGKKQKEAFQRIYASNGNDNISDSEVDTKIYKEARECLNLLSSKLGEKDFFFGKSPSSLDALVYGYLSPLLKAPLQNAPLINHLRLCDNLASLCSRIGQRYFIATPEEAKSEQKAKSEKDQENLDYPNKTRNIVICGLVAVSAMVAYALLSGLVEFEITDLDEPTEKLTYRVNQRFWFQHSD